MASVETTSAPDVASSTYRDDVSVVPDRAVRLRTRLLANAWLFDDAKAYVCGVDDAFDAIADAYDLPALRAAVRRPSVTVTTLGQLPPEGGWFG